MIQTLLICMVAHLLSVHLDTLTGAPVTSLFKTCMIKD